MSQLVTTTPHEGMRPLGSAAERSVQRVRAVLAQEFRQGLGLTLAEPVPRSDGRGIDWYLEEEAPLRRLTEFPPERAAAPRGALHAVVRAVLQRADALDARGSTAARAQAQALRNAVSFPGEEHVWLAEGGAGTPALVLTAWGHERHLARATAPSEIAGRVVAAEAGPSPAREEGAAPWRRRALPALALLLPLALMALTAWALLPACGIRLPLFGTVLFGEGGGVHCRAEFPPAPPADPGDARRRGLLAEIAVLEEQLRLNARLCRPPAAAPEPLPPPEPEPDELDAKIEERGGSSGRLQITLTWQTLDDLDLNVFCAGGWIRSLPGQQGPGICGDGVKDLDSNRNLRENITSDAIENVVWDQDIPEGSYQIEILPYMFKAPSDRRVPFELRIRLDGQEQTCGGFVHPEQARTLTWNPARGLPGCDFETFTPRRCTTDCK